MCNVNRASLEEKNDVNGGRRNKSSDKVLCVGLGKLPTEPYEINRSPSVKLYCSRSLMIKWHGRFRKGQTTVKDDERYEGLSSLRPTFLT